MLITSKRSIQPTNTGVLGSDTTIPRRAYALGVEVVHPKLTRRQAQVMRQFLAGEPVAAADKEMVRALIDGQKRRDKAARLQRRLEDGRLVDKAGYVHIAGQAEHRLVMEKALGRP